METENKVKVKDVKKEAYVSYLLWTNTGNYRVSDYNRDPMLNEYIKHDGPNRKPYTVVYDTFDNKWLKKMDNNKVEYEFINRIEKYDDGKKVETIFEKRIEHHWEIIIHEDFRPKKFYYNGYLKDDDIVLCYDRDLKKTVYKKKE